MAFTKEQEFKVEVLPNRVLQVRRSDIIKEDGTPIATSYHRHVVVPGADVTGECDCVQLIANALHDPETVSAYEASIAEPADTATY